MESSQHPQVQVVQAASVAEWRQARALVEEYAAQLGVDLSFQDLAREIDHLDVEYSPPRGAFLMAHEHNHYLGCVALRPFAAGVGEVKRLYVRPAARGRRIGRLLAEGVIAAARTGQYSRLVLDTLSFMREAQALYVSLGFVPTSAYRFNPMPGTAFLELKL
jgi:GNAT superfamily N-acetyltransferase